MVIAVSDLDKEIKSRISNIVVNALFRRYSTLPQEESEISDVVESSKDALDAAVRAYYRELAERDVDINIGTDDYKKVYMHLI